MARLSRLVASALCGALLIGCQAAPPPAAAPTATARPTRTAKPESTRVPTQTPAEAPVASVRVGAAPVVEPRVYIENVALPVGLSFAPDGRLFFGEVNKGQVRVADGAVLRPEPFLTVQVAQGGERGLLGVTLDPGFEENGWVYVYYTVPKKSGRSDHNRLVRYTDRAGRATEPTVILDEIPADVRGVHNGGRMRFGPDGKLYVLTGAPGEENRKAQDWEALEGKVLRLNPDGSVPTDNPVPGSPIYAAGFRNPYGLDFHPSTGRLFVIDNGPRGADELDLVQPRGNYGWPTVFGTSGDGRFVDPVWHSGNERLGLAGLAFYTGEQLPEYRGDLFFCLFNRGLLHRVRLVGPEFERVEADQDLAVECRVDVANGPDGGLYVAGVAQIWRLGR